MSNKKGEDSNGKQSPKLTPDGSQQGRNSTRDHGAQTGQAVTTSASPGAAHPRIDPPEIVVGSPRAPSPEENALYASHMAEISKRELSSSENFDKSVLTLSSAGLGISVTLLKDVIQLDRALHLPAIYVSWGLFVLAILSTLLSFLVSGKALEHQKDLAYRAYRLGDDTAFTEVNSFDALTRCLNYTSAGAFVLALVLTTTFVIVNMELRSMTTIRQPSPTLEKKGAPVPTLERPPASAPAPAPAPASPPTGSK